MMRRLLWIWQVIKVTDVWKAMKTAEILMEPYLFRVECCSEFSADAEAN